MSLSSGCTGRLVDLSKKKCHFGVQTIHGQPQRAKALRTGNNATNHWNEAQPFAHAHLPGCLGSVANVVILSWVRFNQTVAAFT